MCRERAEVGRIARREAGIGADRDGCDHAVREETAPAAGNVEQFRSEASVFQSR